MGILDEDVVSGSARPPTSSQVISAHTQLKKVGANWSGLCPFHGEKSPSFSVNPEKGVFYCFGCQAKGDVISFVRDIDHLDFAGRGGVPGRQVRASPCATPTSNEGERREARGKLRDAMVAAVDWYHDRLLTAPDAGAARRYLRDRGLRRRARCASTRSAGRPTTGTSWSRRCRSRPRSCATPASAGESKRGRHQRLLPGPGAVPDLRPAGRSHRLRRADDARGPTAEVPEHAGDLAVPQEQGALRAQLGQGRGGRGPTRSSSARATPT